MPQIDEQGGRILIAEDDEHTRTLLKELCESSGYQILVAEDGEQALAQLAGNPDLVLLDLMMPKLDGFKVLETLRQIPSSKDLPVILLTAIGDVEGKCRGMELGADDYITKPFRIIELQTRIRAALSVRRYRDKLRVAEEQLEQIKAADLLTGAGAYPQLKAGLEYEVSRARRYARPLTALIVCVDDFGMLRQELGKEGADALILHTADVLREALRGADRLYRIDVEEFVILLPETDAVGARAAGDRLVKAIAARPAGFKGVTRQVSISIGAAALPDENVQKPDDLVRLANQALLDARRTGPGSVNLSVAAAAR